MNVLIVEDDEALSRFLLRTLECEDYRCDVALDGQRALELCATGHYDLVLLDLNLPEVDGLDVLASLRASSCEASVLVLTGRASLEERVRCLNLGADDCLIKPFALSELRARVAALRRRQSSVTGMLLRFDEVELNRLSRTATRCGRPLELTGKEFALLECLLRHRGGVVSRATLLRDVWQMAPGTETNVVDVYINYLRRKLDLGFAQPLIQTLRGEGYRLQAASSANSQAAVLPMRKPVVSVGFGAAQIAIAGV